MSDFEDRGTGGKRPSWLAPVLALVVIGVLLAIVLVGRGDDEAGTEARGGTSTQADGEVGTRGAEAGAVGGGAATGDGVLTARGVSLLPPPDGGLGQYVGEPVTGAGVPILSVVGGGGAPRGFFAGTSEEARIFVEAGDATTADVQLEPGREVNVQGSVSAAPADGDGGLGLRGVDAQIVQEQGGYVVADVVTPAE